MAGGVKCHNYRYSLIFRLVSCVLQEAISLPSSLFYDVHIGLYESISVIQCRSLSRSSCRIPRFPSLSVKAKHAPNTWSADLHILLSNRLVGLLPVESPDYFAYNDTLRVWETCWHYTGNGDQLDCWICVPWSVELLYIYLEIDTKCNNCGDAKVRLRLCYSHAYQYQVFSRRGPYLFWCPWPGITMPP